jgi:uncharacterized integral membrane protein
MRVVAWIFNLLLFLVALGFALSNTTVTELRFFLFGDDVAWRAPLVIFLLLFFVAGAVVGLLAAFPSSATGASCRACDANCACARRATSRPRPPPRCCPPMRRPSRRASAAEPS